MGRGGPCSASLPLGLILAAGQGLLGQAGGAEPLGVASGLAAPSPPPWGTHRGAPFPHLPPTGALLHSYQQLQLLSLLINYRQDLGEV